MTTTQTDPGAGSADSAEVADLTASVDSLGLFDHHCHGVVRDDLDAAGFTLLGTESDWPDPPGTSMFDSPFGITVRAECAPLLGLERHVDKDTYLARRAELGTVEVTSRLLGATGITTYGIDIGFQSNEVLTPAEMSEVTGQRALTIVRLEQVAEQVFAAGTTPDGFADDFAAALDEASAGAVGYKSIIAYRYGLDFDPTRPSPAEVSVAVADALSAGPVTRVEHPVLVRHLLWAAVDRALPIQFHVGYGDSDITLHRCDPTQMTEFLRLTRESGASIMLLHCYPFQREAGYLAQVFPHVYFDTGAAIGYTGMNSATVIRESLEMTPMHKLLFSSDAFGLPELYYCGTLLWRRGIAEVFGDWLRLDRIGRDDAERYLRLIASENADRVYGQVSR